LNLSEKPIEIFDYLRLKYLVINAISWLRQDSGYFKIVNGEALLEIR